MMFNSLSFRIGVIIILVEMIVLAVLGFVYVNRFMDEVDRRVAAQAQLPGVLMNAGLLAFDAVSDPATMRELVGDELVTGMVVGVNGNVFYALDPDLLGLDVADIPGVDATLFDINDLRDVHIHELERVVAVSPIYAADQRTPRFFIYTVVSNREAAAEKAALTWLFVLGSLATVIVTSLVIIASFRLLISRRIGSLAEVLRRVETGDMTARVTRVQGPTSQDEIGFLQRSTNDMINARQQAETQIIHLNRVLRAIRNVNQLITQERDLDRLLEGACERLTETASYAAVWILLLNDDGTPLKFFRKDMDGNTLSLSDLDERDEMMACTQVVLAQAGAQIIETGAGTCQECFKSIVRGGPHNAMAIRLEYAEKVYGVFNIAVLTEHIIDAEEISLFEELAGDISFALHGLEVEEERKRAVAEKLAAEAHLRQGQKLESIGTLASGIAHEVNNPLMGMIGYAELIAAEVDDQTVGKYTEGIIKEGNRVATIVQNLLSFARQDKESHSPADIKDIIDASLSLVGAILRKDQIALDLDVPDDLPRVKCRSQQIEQVVVNLLTNARDALNLRYSGFDENKFLLVTVRPLEKDGTTWVRTTIEDHGPGIPEDLLQRIFDPFFTTKPRDEGTGLGLSVSYGIMKEHQGELTVESEVGRYTRFHMDLLVDNNWTLRDQEESD